MRFATCSYLLRSPFQAVRAEPIIAASTVCVLASTARARRMGEAGRQRALTRYSVDAMVAEYEALYERVLSGRETSP